MCSDHHGKNDLGHRFVRPSHVHVVQVVVTLDEFRVLCHATQLLRCFRNHLPVEKRVLRRSWSLRFGVVGELIVGLLGTWCRFGVYCRFVALVGVGFGFWMM